MRSLKGEPKIPITCSITMTLLKIPARHTNLNNLKCVFDITVLEMYLENSRMNKIIAN